MILELRSSPSSTVGLSLILRWPCSAVEQKPLRGRSPLGVFWIHCSPRSSLKISIWGMIVGACDYYYHSYPIFRWPRLVDYKQSPSKTPPSFAWWGSCCRDCDPAIMHTRVCRCLHLCTCACIIACESQIMVLWVFYPHIINNPPEEWGWLLIIWG